MEAVAAAIEAAGDVVVNEVAPMLDAPTALREKHLVAALRAALAQGGLHAVTGKVIAIPDWPSLGRSGVDIAAVQDGVYPLLAEAKWCHSGKDKIYEGIWDLFKMALGTCRPEASDTALITGAPAHMWETGFCRDLLEGGEFTPEELCARVLPWGLEPRWFAWDDLLYGGYDRHPIQVPHRIVTSPIGKPVALELEQPWLIRSVAVSVIDHAPVPFVGGWPHGDRPPGAHHPKPPERGEVFRDSPVDSAGYPSARALAGIRFPGDKLDVTREVHPRLRVVAERPDRQFLLTEDDATAYIYHGETNVLHGPLPLNSLMARGYWSDPVTSPDPHAVWTYAKRPRV
jgi:hypothetical protein